METFLAAIDFKALGVGGILLAYAMYQNWILRKDLESEREYSRELNEKFQEFGLKVTETLHQLREAVRDSSR